MLELKTMNTLKNIYEECLATATKNMLPLGYFPDEIEKTAASWAQEKFEKMVGTKYAHSY